MKKSIKKLIIINIILLFLVVFLQPPKIEIVPENTIAENIITDNIISAESENIIESETIFEPDNELYRITSYYPAENSNTTGSGKTTNDFDLLNVEGKSVYSYQGRIVVAGATNELLKSGYNKNGSQNNQNKHYFNYYDTGRMKINDKWYGFIVLDSCGASMWQGY